MNRKGFTLQRRSGFTLIELLVVIAIIGLLSSLAIISLNSARNKAYDAQIKSDLSQLRIYSEVTYSDGDYTDLDIADVTPAIAPPACSADAAYTIVINTAGDAWAAYADLCADDTNNFCVDSSGQAKVSATDPTALSPVCP